MGPKFNTNGPLLWSALFLVLGAVAIGSSLVPIYGSLTRPGIDEVDVNQRFATLMELHEADRQTYEDRFDGRSLFFAPPARRPPPGPRDDGPTDPPPPPPPPVQTGPPANYQGPSIRAIVGETVWFHGELVVALGEEKEGVTVLAIDAPWSARIGHSGGEYDVALFEHSGESFLKDPNAPSESAGDLLQTVQAPAETEPPATGAEVGAGSVEEQKAGDLAGESSGAGEPAPENKPQPGAQPEPKPDAPGQGSGDGTTKPPPGRPSTTQPDKEPAEGEK